MKCFLFLLVFPDGIGAWRRLLASSCVAGVVSRGIRGDVRGSYWTVHNGLVILCEDRNLSNGHPRPLPGTNGHTDALNALRKGCSEVVSIHLPILKVLNVCKALA